MRLIKSFGEQVGPVVIRVHPNNVNQMLFGTVTDEVVANLYMLGLGVFHRVVYDRHGSIVVNLDWGASEIEAVVPQLVLNPQDLRCAASGSYIFSFRG